MNNKNNKNFKNIIIISVLFFSFITLISCTKSKVDETVESIYIPEAANQFAIDKETEEETIEETGAHHIYPEDFKLANDKEVVIGEKQFLTKIDYIYKNIDKFLNSNIIVEGMYGLYKSWDETFQFPMVYRNGPGCHGDDQYGGFYLVNIDTSLLQIDDWIKVTGKPFMYEHTDSEGEVKNYLFILVEDLKILTLKERKAEMVNN